MKRTLFGEEHEIFRKAFRQFLQKEVVPNQEAWREEGSVSREVWRAAGAQGFLCPWLEEEHGGPGGDFLHSVVVIEELAKVYESGFALPLHSDVVVPYIHEFGTPEQKKKWLPGCANGELVTAIAMTEPGTGSDLAGIRTTAKKDGDDYVLNGAKTFISNGILCDLCIVAAKTGGPDDDPHRSISLFVVEAGREGFLKSKKLKKMGMASQDTAELAFEDCRVPKENLLGMEGGGFLMLMQKLQQERLVVGASCQAGAAQVLEDTIAYCKEREAFGRPISKFQNTRFKLVECATEVEVGQAFLDKLLAAHVAGQYLVKECSMSKLWHSEMMGRVVDECLQFFGGYGYMLEYPVTRAYMDARVQRIYAGTSEIMKVIISKQMGL
ncbi:MAG TPA: acyl-CoA dehydrogenase family protein [Polyangiaceae bacterium LLY-WYZ-15_(1-7)]|nr:acyl-CoA dehydrogenase [Sandaracinus sp.]HJL03557.1 acyl-CoA dehydrogenase family protein [Polyangiaceae bacterium LLY-WYZ-15_(1-7)]MBJ73901.1 acyl-CoA dehydrogenase [Sandaracinus sp.]HJL09401.1 acyl-CoA dehydrogenase family protein [Polyangiaceae bacterium LLY-WYZ-15_(1-7)]HJL21586.1 acyl-CoA dehydrogenase family protein [Polyangiaceae bacterium LLY-WYZ-15_(1-7)]